MRSPVAPQPAKAERKSEQAASASLRERIRSRREIPPRRQVRPGREVSPQAQVPPEREVSPQAQVPPGREVSPQAQVPPGREVWPQAQVPPDPRQAGPDSSLTQVQPVPEAASPVSPRPRAAQEHSSLQMAAVRAPKSLRLAVLERPARREQPA
jgi:S-DNA-T family DNA segregation ATPase FtsK/SpoIIIE